ncbi:tyrosine-type recombinase/integrase [Bradyrhizobium sp. Ash2021]|uniref:tyrosine-type recombinase/integrase n=1 Tax=Bradyrhizobium sp. Ash2021 TaxID=2954771 RepID=UPI002814B399|nr:tyrosine-type recombinase/integrase [Bradyrhizobium sp. Ash2021]WMT71071.1 site-specific integrase [Bradyrhizobium sp. Ash2021]
MKGHIRERSPGHFAIILDQRDPATGKRKRKWYSFEGTKRQAQIECSRLITEIRSGSNVEPSKITVLQFLERWLKHVKPNVSPKTHERYEQIALKNIAPLIGAKLLLKLKPIEISEAYSQALESGRCDGKGGLAPRTVHHMHRILFSALDQAERWKLIARNPAALLEKRDRPKIEKKAVRTIDAPATADVFDAARKRRLFIPLVLAAFCGLRRGEITAIRWRAIDLDRGQLAVLASTEQLDDGTIREKEAKSGRARTVALPSLAVEELRRWRLLQAQELLRLGTRTDDDWLVVTQADGSALQPRSLTHVVSAFLKEWGVTLKGLRHSHASHMLASNIHPKIVQERLGHSSIAITMDIYSHLMPNMQGDAADAVDVVLRAAINRRSKDVG